MRDVNVRLHGGGRGGKRDELARRGRLFKMRLERNRLARQAALRTVAPTGDGWFTARIGGLVRGRDVAFRTREAAEAAVNDHYNRRMTAFTKEQA